MRAGGFVIGLVVSMLPLLSASCQKEGPDGGGDSDPADEIVEYETLQAKSPKRGVSFNFAQLADYDFPLLGDAVSWYYDWSSVVPSETVDSYMEQYGIEFCPMIWNGSYDPENIRTFCRTHPDAKYILAFNEPNLTDQANMTPSQAAEYWPEVKALAEELGMGLISPAMNYGTLEGYGDPYLWIDEFFAQPGVSVDDVDGIAVHCYMGSASALKSYLDGFKKYGKPLWLTEFCAWDRDNISAVSQMEYMAEAINLLEADADVFRYAWFIPRGNGESEVHNSLLTSRVPIELTDLGAVFVNMSTQDASLYYETGTVIPAEHYRSASGSIHLRPVTDVSGILEVYNLRTGNSLTYQVEAASAGSFGLQLRYSSFADSSVEISTSEGVCTLDLENTGNEWRTVTAQIELPAGRSTVSVAGTGSSGVCLNWLLID